MLRIIVLTALFVAASLSQSRAEDRFFGFTLKGEVINPLCLEHIHPWYSDGVIIVKSLILDYCQESNWAFADSPIEVQGNVVSTKVKGAIDSEVTSSTFSYEIVGRTDNGLFIAILAGNSEIAAYRIDEQVIRSDLFAPRPETVHMLTQVSLSTVDCLRKAWVKGNTVFIEKNVSDDSAPRSQRCTPKTETQHYDVTP